MHRLTRLIVSVLLATNLIALHAGGPGPALARTVPPAQPAAVQPCGASISFGQTMACAISVAAEVDTISLSGSANDVVQIRVGITSGSVRPVLRVTSAAAVKICDAPTPYYGAEISRCVLPTSGAYTISIADYYGTQVGNYNLYVQRLSGPVGTASLTVGSSTTGSIATAASEDAFTLTVASSDVLFLQAGVTAGTLLPDLRLYGSDGVLICSKYNTSGPGVEIGQCILPKAGSYTVLIGDVSYLNRTGSYNLFVQSLQHPVGAAAYSVGEVRPASLQAAAEIDSYSLAGSAGDILELRIGLTAGALIPAVRVFGPDGVQLCSTSNSYSPGAEISRCVLPQSATYVLLVTDVRSVNTGSYNLFAQRLRDPVSPQTLSTGTLVSGSIAAVAKVNAYTLSGIANDVLLIRISATAGELVPGAILFDPDGIAVCQFANSYSRAIELPRCALPRNGAYTLFVADTSVVRTGNYNLHVQSVAKPVNSQLIIGGETANGTIAGPPWTKAYTWLAGQSDSLQLRMTITSGTIRPSLRVYDPDGTKICEQGSSYNPTVEISPCLLPRSGAFTILTTDSTMSSNGTFSLSVSCLSQTCGSAVTQPVTETGRVLRLGELTVTVPPNAVTAATSMTLGLWTSPAGAIGEGEQVLRSFLFQAMQSGQELEQTALPMTFAANYSGLAGTAVVKPYLAQWDVQSQRWINMAGQTDDGGTITATSKQIAHVALILPAPVKHSVFVPIVSR